MIRKKSPRLVQTGEFEGRNVRVAELQGIPRECLNVRLGQTGIGMGKHTLMSWRKSRLMHETSAESREQALKGRSPEP